MQLVKMRSRWIKMGPESDGRWVSPEAGRGKARAITQREQRVVPDAETRAMRPQAKEHREFPATAGSQEEKRGAGPPSEAPEETNLAATLISDFQTPKLREKICCFKPLKFAVICSGSPGKPIHLSSQHSLPPTPLPKPSFSQEDPCGSMKPTGSYPSWLRPVNIFHLHSP